MRCAYIKVLPAKRWGVLIADREFSLQVWFGFLRWKGIWSCRRTQEMT